MIRVAGELFDSLANGPGMRYVLFTQGCKIGCPECQNKHTWSMNGGVLMTYEEIINHINESPFITGVTLSGGDPIDQAQQTSELCLKIKEERPDLNIMLYTGRTLEQLKALKNKHIETILNTIDYLVDGRFESDKIEGASTYTGSSNQKIYDLKKNIEIRF